MRALVADAHPEDQWAQRTVVVEQPGLTMAGESSDHVQLVQQAGTPQPDMIVNEWELPEWPGGDRLAALRSISQGVRVSVLSQHPEAELAALRGLVHRAETDALTVT